MTGTMKMINGWIDNYHLYGGYEEKDCRDEREAEFENEAEFNALLTAWLPQPNQKWR